ASAQDAMKAAYEGVKKAEAHVAQDFEAWKKAYAKYSEASKPVFDALKKAQGTRRRAHTPDKNKRVHVVPRPLRPPQDTIHYYSQSGDSPHLILGPQFWRENFPRGPTGLRR
ncbi:MAG: hypothetical protein ABSF48_29225, partial [Thermodesulfobacteriota bacterium]